MATSHYKQQTYENLLNKPIEVKIKPLGLDADKLLTEEVMKVLRHEYACKYLEVMGIEPNAKNVNTILKMKPLSKCRIETGEGQHDAVDLIRIYPNPEAIVEVKKKSKKTEQLRAMDCDRLFNSKLQKFEELYQQAKMNSSFDQDGKEQPDEGVTTAQGTTGSMMEAKMAAGTIGDKFLPSLFKSEARYDDKLLDYGFENIKLKYMVRADKMENSNQRTLRKVQSTNSLENQDDTTVYEFDFTKYRLEKQVIRELQAPFEITSGEIKIVNSHFMSQFPFMRIPIVNIQKLAEEKKIAEYLVIYGEDKKRFSEKKYIEIQMNHSYSKNKFELLDIKLLRQILDSDQINKVQGLLLHLSNSMVFGKLALVQVEPLKNKQMLVLMMNYFTNLETEVRENVRKRGHAASGPEMRLWSRLICPILLINLKMITEYFYLKKCPNFLKVEKTRNDTLRLIFSLIEEIFDPSALNSQVLFWHDVVSCSDKVSSK